MGRIIRPKLGHKYTGSGWVAEQLLICPQPTRLSAAAAPNSPLLAGTPPAGGSPEFPPELLFLSLLTLLLQAKASMDEGNSHKP